MIRCLECRKKMRQITWKHLAHHSMSVYDYKIKNKLTKRETICEETRQLKIASQSKCSEYLKKLPRPSGKSISDGMKKKRFKHFWGESISKSMTGRKKTVEHLKNISIARTNFCKKFRILSDSDIATIRKLYIPKKHTKFSCSGLAESFGVSDSTIYSIVDKRNGYKWNV